MARQRVKGFYLHRTHRTKAAAQKRAVRLRKQGWRVRVIPLTESQKKSYKGKKWGVWVPPQKG